MTSNPHAPFPKSFAQKYKVRHAKTNPNVFVKRNNKKQSKKNTASAQPSPKKRLKREESASRRSRRASREARNKPAPAKTPIVTATATPSPPSPSRDLDFSPPNALDFSPPNAFASPRAIAGPTTSLVPAKFSRTSTALITAIDEVKAKLKTPTSSPSVDNLKSDSDSTVDVLALAPTKNELPAVTPPPVAFLRVNVEPSFDELVDKTDTVVSPPSFESVLLKEEDDSFEEGYDKIIGPLNETSVHSLENIDVSSSDAMFDLGVMFGDSSLTSEDASDDTSTPPGSSPTTEVSPDEASAPSDNLQQEPLAWDPRPLASAGKSTHAAVVTEQDIEGVSNAECLQDTRELIKADVDYNNPNECIIHEDGLTRSPLDKPALERYRIKNLLESHLKEEWWFAAESMAGDAVAAVEVPRKSPLERLVSLTAVMVETSDWHRSSCARDNMEVFLVGSRLVELWGLVLNFMTLDSDAKARIPAVKKMCARIDWLCRRGCLDTQTESPACAATVAA